jgi:hypothetical protein
MKLKSLAFVLAILTSPIFGLAQSNTTEALEKKYDNSLALFFYHNTLRMLNQKEDKGFDELIKDIEKMKFLMIKKDQDSFDRTAYKNLVNDYKGESFEEIMTSRFEGKNFDVFIREKDNKTKAMLVLINDDTNLFVLDILGSIALNKVTELYNTLDESADIGSQIKRFAGGKDDEEKDSKKKEKNN